MGHILANIQSAWDVTDPAWLLQRFQSKYKINPVTNCWEWLGKACGGDGSYGLFFVKMIPTGRLSVPAHVASWIIHNGFIAEGLCVLHQCDVRICVNYQHLFLGTRDDNNKDRASKGRTRGGGGLGNAKLNWDKVRAIRAEPRTHGYRDRLTTKYGIGYSTLDAVMCGRTWVE